jgi:NAD(P)-dependent dehydrogenase (short-subunit alcohol dehydrogenase family)
LASQQEGADIPDRVKGKVALVTGGSSGIGRAAALLFAREGATVIVADIDAAGGAETIAKIKSEGSHAQFVPTDISSSAEVAALIAGIVDNFGRLDCAFNNAGILGDIVSIVDHTEAMWHRAFETNLKGTWLCMKHEIPQMLAQGRGTIVNTTSTAGVQIGSPFRSAYAASKAGIVSLTKSAALEYAEHGLRVNALCPSHTRTPLLEQFFKLRPELEASFIAQTPMGRIAAPEEVAEGALWLCSDASSFVTGQVLVIDGGYVTR